LLQWSTQLATTPVRIIHHPPKLYISLTQNFGYFSTTKKERREVMGWDEIAHPLPSPPYLEK